MKTYNIDVKDKILGRIASEVAVLLRGKKEPDFAPNKIPQVKVIIENLDGIKVSGKKMEQKDFKRYSGYPGGLTLEKMGHIAERKGMGFVFTEAVKGMIPKNKLRGEILKNLIIKTK